jgi:hypothetical protein
MTWINILCRMQMIEQKGITFDQHFGYSFPLFSSLLKKRGKKKMRMNSNNRDFKSCLSARSSKNPLRFTTVRNLSYNHFKKILTNAFNN